MKDEISDDIQNWIGHVSNKMPELNGHAICPFAKKANYKIVHCNASEIVIDEHYDVIIYVIEPHFTLNEVQEWVDYHNERCEKWSFFEDCASYDTFIKNIQTNNGKYNLIIGQPREKLRKYREILAKTDYYHQWSDEYLKEILAEDYDIIDFGIETP